MKNTTLLRLIILLTVVIQTKISSAQLNCGSLPSNLQNGLIAYYLFSGNAHDTTGNGNDGTVFGATLTSDRFGHPSSAYSFDGTTYIKGSCTNFPTQDRTVSIWYKIDNWDNHNSLMGYGGGICGTSFFATLDNLTGFGSDSHCGHNPVSTFNGFSENSNWNNWIITSNGTKTVFYLNGIKIYESNVSYYGTDVSGKDFAFGSMSSPSGYAPYSDVNVSYLIGSLDDITIYNRALDSTEAVQLYNYFAVTSISANGATTVCKPAIVMLSATPTGNGLTYQWKKGNNNISGATNSTYTATKSATYKCVVTNACSSSTSNSISVTINAQPTATITPLGNLDICQSDSVVLQANSGMGYTYQWMKGSNNISGATNQNYTATKAATYKVVVTNSNSCSKTSKGTKVTKSCREESITAMNAQLSIFPNPSDGKFTLSFSTDDERQEKITIEVINLIVQIVLQQQATLNEGQLTQEISMPDNVTEGIYLVRVAVGKNIFQQKLIYRK